MMLGPYTVNERELREGCANTTSHMKNLRRPKKKRLEMMKAFTQIRNLHNGGCTDQLPQRERLESPDVSPRMRSGELAWY